jgi:hypothetical protein
MKAQPGDKIIVTQRDCRCHGAIGFVHSSDEIFNRIWVNKTGGWGQFWLNNGSYKILEDTDVPEVGDSIIITTRAWGKDRYKTFEISAIDGCYTKIADSLEWWANPYLYKDEYKILKRNPKTSKQTCLDCNGTGQIQLFSSTVRCECNEKD